MNDNTKRNRNGKLIYLDDYEGWKIDIEIPNALSFKTVQLDIRGWIKLTDNDINQHQWDNVLFPLQKKIKQEIRMMKIPGFHSDSIVLVASGKMHSVKLDYQFLKTDICLYVKDCPYDRLSIRKLIETFTQTIIDKYLNTNDNFKVTVNERMEGRINKIRETRKINARNKIETI